MPHPIHRVRATGRGWLLLGLALSGCATAVDPNGPKIVIEDKYVTLDAPLGSHLKRRVRISEAVQPGISPTRKEVPPPDQDIMLQPPTAGEMQRMISEQPPRS